MELRQTPSVSQHVERVKYLLVRLGDLSPNLVLSKLSRLVRRRAPTIRPPSIEFLKSRDYHEMMLKHVPCDGQYGLHEAQTYTLSFQYRHKACLGVLGVFRWRGLYEHLEEILPYLSDPQKLVVDLGGAGCPLGFHSIVVDRLRKDAMGRPVLYSSVSQLGRPVDVVFACHVFEHIAELDHVLDEIHAALAPGGVLIALAPAFTNERWRAGRHSHRTFGGHLWTFGLSGTTVCRGLQNYANLDELIGRRLRIEKACYCGDDSIFVFARKVAGVISG